jgi:hypothetical protein
MSNGNGNSNTNNFLISKNQTSRFSARSRASLTRTLYVSLDNADKVIEGGPPIPQLRLITNRIRVPHPFAFFAKGWEARMPATRMVECRSDKQAYSTCGTSFFSMPMAFLQPVTLSAVTFALSTIFDNLNRAMV